MIFHPCMYYSLTYCIMNCPICFEENDDMYTIACGSNTPHQICHSCEISMRCSATPTNQGRFIKCPLCRAVEPTQGKRTIKSYEAELTQVYNLQVPVAPRQVPVAPRQVPTSFPMIRLDGDTVHIYLQHRTISVVMPPQHIIQFMTPHQLHLIAVHFAQLYTPPVAPPVAPPRQVPVAPRQVPVAPRQVSVAPRQVPVAPPVAPVIPRIWCQSGRRTLGLCPTKSKTRRRCSFDNCSLRVCIACKRCTTH